MGQWHFRQPLDLLGRADVAPVDADLAVKLLHPGVPGEARIHESRGVAEQVLNRHLALGRYQRVDRLPGVGIEPRDTDLELPERREVLRDGVAQDEPPLLDEHHRRDRGERLGHRVEPEDRVRRHRRAGRRVALAEALEVSDPSLARHQDDRARVLALCDFGLKHLGHACEPLRRESDLLGLGRGQGVGPDECCEEESDEGGDRGREPLHGGPPYGDLSDKGEG